jgi:hypothetical protein
MAKRRKKRTTGRRRSRRMGAIPGGIGDVLTIAAGAVAGSILASKVLPNMDAKIKNAGLIAVGAFVFPKIVKGATGSSLGKGMAAAGVLGLLKDIAPGIVSGMEDTISIPFTVGEVPDNLSVIAGDSVMAGDLAVLSGDDDSED